MNIANKYGDILAAAPSMPLIREALKLYGVKETAGAGDNPVILEWATELGGSAKAIYMHDEVPWCGLFMGVCALRAGYIVPMMAIRALAWRDFGTAVTEPCLGDVLVFVRPGGGHVGIYVGEDDDAFHVLGGNQGDQVKIARIERASMRAARRPLYPITPAGVRPIIRAPEGDSTTPMV